MSAALLNVNDFIGIVGGWRDNKLGIGILDDYNHFICNLHVYSVCNVGE